MRQKNLKKSQAKIKKVLHFQYLLYLPEIIKTNIISKYYNNSLIGYFEIKENLKLITQKYYQPNLQANINIYMKDCNV